MTLSYLITKRKRSNNFFRGSALGGDGGPLQAVAAPPNPASAGNNLCNSALLALIGTRNDQIDPFKSIYR